MVRKKTGSLPGAIYLLVGAALLVSALFAPWYFYDGQPVWPGGGESAPLAIRDTSFFLTPVPGIAPVQATCPLWEPFTPPGGYPNVCPLSTTYSGAWFNSIGQVAGATFALAAAGAAVAAVGGVLGLILANAPRRRFPELVFALVAVALAISATAAFAVLLPGAFARDIPAGDRYPTAVVAPVAAPGPWSSFFGSVTYRMFIMCPVSGCPNFTASWGPGIGWAFSVAAIPVLVLGAVMTVRFRHDVAESTPPSASIEPERESNTPKSTT
jgi:hypothetical protein